MMDGVITNKLNEQKNKKSCFSSERPVQLGYIYNDPVGISQLRLLGWKDYYNCIKRPRYIVQRRLIGYGKGNPVDLGWSSLDQGI